jgi:signal transduction histidine kinase
MSSVDQPVQQGGYLAALLRAGAPVIAEVPTELPEEAVDPAPLPGWQRISMMAGSHGTGDTDSLLTRACRYVVLVPLAYRIVVIPVLLLSVLTTDNGAGLLPGAMLAAVAVAVNVGALVAVLRIRGFRGSVARTLLAADIVIAFGLNLVAALVVPDPGYTQVGIMTWAYLIGSVVLVTLTRGVPAGSWLILASVPFHVLMTVLGRHDGPRTSPVAAVVDDVVTLVPALVTAMVVLILIGLGTRLALSVGIRRGRRSEHVRMQRTLHDTVLQALEAMALSPVAPADLDEAVTQLTELRGIARAQAMDLRRGLTEPVETAGATGIGEELASVAAEMAREGLRARLVFTEVDDGSLSEARRRAVRDAVREAMRNTMKHAGTDEVVLRVEQRDGGIAVIARDHGAGFSDADQPVGFGISNSITARLADVGGSSTVESEPGRGTRVTLWVPL